MKKTEMRTIDEAKAEKQEISEQITKLLRSFELKYGEDSVRSLNIKRWNGRSAASGPVTSVEVNVDFC